MMTTITRNTAPRGSVQVQQQQQQRPPASTRGASISPTKLKELAAVYRRRYLHRAADAIERGVLLKAGTLPDFIEPAVDSSATSLWPQDFRDRQLTPPTPRLSVVRRLWAKVRASCGMPVPA